MKKQFLILTALLLASLLVLFATGCESTDKPAETEAPGTQPDETEETPENDTAYEGPEFFVALDGSDEWPGSSEQPFATLKHAMETVRSLRAAGKTDAFTVTVREGRYKLEPFSFTAEDGGLSIDEPVTYRGEGDVMLDGGMTIPVTDFGPVTDEGALARFDPAVADKIVCVDLSSYGVTREVLGELKAFGSAAQPTGDEYRGYNSSVFWNDERISMARYPNDSKQYLPEDFLWISSAEDVIDPGVRGESGGTLRLPAEANDRLSKWATLEDVWAFGYFMYDWADETTPVKAYDPEEGTVTFLFPSYDGYGESWGQYYFYNVAEELDVPGEYWIDRNTMMMYLYPVDDDPASVVGINLEKTDIFTGEIVNTVFENFTIKGSCGNIFGLASSNGLTIRYCLVKDCDGYLANVGKANNSTVFGCELCHLGKGGVYFNGAGDSVTLTHGNNLIENNHLHHFAEVQRMYSGGFGLNGVGGTIRHNEIDHSPHSGLSAGGQENLIEWNYVHDMVQESGDAGAYYGGGQWHSIGNVIQYNKFENIGNETHNGTAIYFDDGLSGWTARYNLIIDASCGFILGGGRNIEIYNNLVIMNNFPEKAFGSFDQRMRTWYLEGKPNLTTYNVWWTQLEALPYTTGIWAERYPNLAASHFDQTNIDDVNFLCNPSYDVIKNNILIGESHRWSYNFEEAYYTYATMENNMIYPSLDRVFEEGTYELNKVGKRSIPEWEALATEGYGTYEAVGPR